MKKYVLTIFVFVSASLFGQIPSDYFPSSLSYVWYFQNYTLDSNNIPIEATLFWTKDSLADEIQYNGYDSKVILNTTGNATTIDILPYYDTTFVAFDENNAGIFVDLTTLIDTSIFSDENFYNTLKSLSGWYFLYHFSSPPYLEYEILSVDTTIEIDSVEYPLRFLIKGERNSDETIETEIGTFECKKFLITSSVNYVQHTPFGNILIPIVSKENNVWIAPNTWIVKEFSPSRFVDFSQLGGPRFLIPGSQKTVATQPTNVENNYIVNNFSLKQNYPNPFNPTTTIEYEIARNGLEVKLMVFDITGKVVARLVNKKENAGLHSVKFYGNELSSGVYFYKLKAGNFEYTRKMILLK